MSLLYYSSGEDTLRRTLPLYTESFQEATDAIKSNVVADSELDTNWHPKITGTMYSLTK
jgi:hypothetical protein